VGVPGEGEPVQSNSRKKKIGKEKPVEEPERGKEEKKNIGGGEEKPRND